jgi:uncharacterized membrane protein
MSIQNNDFLQSNLKDLLNQNIQKMNFQHDKVFQIRNWAIVITTGILALIWNSSEKNLFTLLAFHLLAILLIIYLLNEDKKWFIFFIIFRERVKLLEDIIISNDSLTDFEVKYYQYIPQNKDYPDTQAIKSNFNTQIMYNLKYYLILILFIITSLILKLFFLCKH